MKQTRNWATSSKPNRPSGSDEHPQPGAVTCPAASPGGRRHRHRVDDDVWSRCAGTRTAPTTRRNRRAARSTRRSSPPSRWTVPAPRHARRRATRQPGVVRGLEGESTRRARRRSMRPARSPTRSASRAARRTTPHRECRRGEGDDRDREPLIATHPRRALTIAAGRPSHRLSHGDGPRLGALATATTPGADDRNASPAPGIGGHRNLPTRGH